MEPRCCRWWWWPEGRLRPIRYDFNPIQPSISLSSCFIVILSCIFIHSFIRSCFFTSSHPNWYSGGTKFTVPAWTTPFPTSGSNKLYNRTFIVPADLNCDQSPTKLCTMRVCQLHLSSSASSQRHTGLLQRLELMHHDQHMCWLWWYVALFFEYFSFLDLFCSSFFK